MVKSLIFRYAAKPFHFYDETLFRQQRLKDRIFLQKREEGQLKVNSVDQKLIKKA